MKKLILITVVMFFTLALSAQKKDDRPNILWLTCEDISPYLSMYGDSTAHTPNLDQLAKEGLVFDNVYAVVGVCAPSRSSIITGMYPTSIGTMHMRTALDIQSWGKRKYGKGMAIDINGDPVPQYSAVIPPYVKCFTEYMRESGYYCTNNKKTDYQFAAPVTAWDENNAHAEWDHTPEGMPFFSVYNHGVTHESQIWKRKNEPQTVSPDKVPLPSYFPDDSIVRQDVARNYSNIEVLDKQIGERIQKLKDEGIYDNTIIFFFSDHGGPLPRGKRLHYVSGLKVPFIVRIPEKYKKKYGIDPSKVDENGHVKELISFVDLAPTLLSIAGYPIPDYMQGQAFLGPQAAKKERKYVFGSADRFDEHTDRMRVVTDGRYLFVKNYYPERPAYKDIAYRRNIDMMNDLLYLHKMGRLNAAQNYWFRLYKTPEEFYDCQTDPDNVHNIIDDPKYKDKIDELRTALDNWLAETGDLGAVPEKELFLNMWLGGKQPVTKIPTIERKGKYIELKDATYGASIGYIISEKDFKPDLNSGWKVYYKPIKVPKGKYLYMMAQRIGYKESDIVKQKF